MKYVGTKQVLKAVQSGEITKVYIGKDVEGKVVEELIKTCKQNKIKIVYIPTMKELGKLAGIEIEAATAAE